jgi:hypothetical protein
MELSFKDMTDLAEKAHNFVAELKIPGTAADQAHYERQVYAALVALMSEVKSHETPVNEQATQAAEPEPIQHAAGGFRSAIMPYYSAIPTRSLERIALRATGTPKGDPPLMRDGFEYNGGSDGYGYGNWRRGLEFEDTFNHVIGHLYHWKESLEDGHRPSDDDLAAAAWGILFPLMTFENRYQDAQRARLKLFAVYGPKANPAEIDREMGEQGKWLKPLAPKKSATQQQMEAQEKGKAPETQMPKEQNAVAATCTGNTNLRAHHWRWHDPATDEFKCDHCGQVASSPVLRVAFSAGGL